MDYCQSQHCQEGGAGIFQWMKGGVEGSGGGHGCCCPRGVHMASMWMQLIANLYPLKACAAFLVPESSGA